MLEFCSCHSASTWANTEFPNRAYIHQASRYSQYPSKSPCVRYVQRTEVRFFKLRSNSDNARENMRRTILPGVPAPPFT
ncbi:hypothetical protein COCCADRAFT_94538 [Bipolaris zeicola 26-R-13]|uniref:Uncharacterized protein n=1 Tax=Cochliobolus carbonum (strain 26-R-13) TaxID=930089 RepID=W6Y2P5_COCC2|nr:uncharacterized protein COCCADRAFT_94538 [Bipolaris zeicola 26-R-13]EUC34007.1 hypothetical protein COCCADRAFT_94538 [Bipolaris zeicola 26-R-13]